MTLFDDYPYSAIRDAFRSMLGRLMLVLLSIFLAAVLAGITATREIGGAVVGIVTLPGMLPASLFVSVGSVVCPLVILFACLFARSEWPLRTVGIGVVLMWWNLHATLRWTLYDSPLLNEQRKFQRELQQQLNSAQSAAQLDPQAAPR